ncbi:MAG: PAS domain S-box protein, partial [Anaerolineae bacterium]|nr:PAS domain S-box protein [Anaerolineae bacterium]
MKPFQVYLLIAVVIIGFYAGLAYTLDQQVVAEHERGFNDEQARQVLTAVSNLEAHHENIAHTFTLVSQYAIGGYLEDMVSRPLFEQILNTISNDVNHERLVVSYYTEPGVYELGYVQPTPLGDAARALADDWAVEYWDTVEQIDTYITTPFVATPEAQLYGLVFPTYELFPRSFAGVLVVVLDYRPVIERYIAPLRSGTYGAAWVHNSDGVVIYDHEPSEIGRGLDDISAGYPDLQRLLRTTLEQEAGRGEYHYTLTVGGKVVRKLVAWNTAYLFGQRITVAMSAPDTEINASLGVFRLQSVALGGLLGLSLIASGAVFYMTRQRELKRVVAARTQELETMTHELQALTGQLDQRVRERTVELDHERAQLAAILDAMSDGLVYHENHRVKYVNAAFTRLLGYTAEEMIGQSADFQREMVDSEEDLQRARQRYEQHRASPDLVNIPWSYELKMKRKDGTCFDAALTSVPICNPQGERLGGAEVFRDISEQKALQDQKDSFITNASHELRRPLTNLKVRTYLLYQQPDQLETHLPLIERAGDEM